MTGARVLALGGLMAGVLGTVGGLLGHVVLIGIGNAIMLLANFVVLLGLHRPLGDVKPS